VVLKQDGDIVVIPSDLLTAVVLAMGREPERSK